MKINNKKKQNYLSPELTVVQFRVERGYAMSTEVLSLIWFNDDDLQNGDRNIESRNNDNGYTWGDGSWF